MATRSLRNRTSSRFASPAVQQAANTTANVEPDPSAIAADNATASRHDEHEEEDDGVWREPPVRVLPPSYKDHKGLERVGVLELQQPLGVPPSQKLLQRLKLNYARGGGSSASNRATPLPDDEVLSQGLGGAESETLPESGGSPMDVVSSGDVATMLPQQQQQADTEQMNMIISSPPRGRPSNRDMAAMQAAFPIEEGTPSPVKSNFEGTPQQSQSGVIKPTSIQEHLRQERVQNYVNRAVNEAQDRGDWGLVPGLEKIRRNANDKRDLWMVLEAVAHQNPTPEQLHIFKKFIKKGLRKYRRESAGSHGSHPFLGGEIGIKGEQLGGGSEFTSPYRTRPASGHLHPESPSSRRHRNGALDNHASNQTLRVRNSRRRRSGSNSTTSSLSSAKSIPEEHAPSETNMVGSSGGDERGASNGQDSRQAEESRPSAGPRLRLVNKNSSINPFDPNSQFNTTSSKIISEKLKKTQQAREEADAELAEIEKRRKRFVRESFVDYNYIPRPEAKDRHQLRNRQNKNYDESIESVDSTQLPPPPPVVHPDPVRPKGGPTVLRLGKGNESSLFMNGTARKRDYDEFAASDDDSDALTPLSSSPAPPYDPPPPPPNAVNSRSATPRTRSSGPAPKAARKSARVLVSPNKSKNGGITAGFTRAGPPARIAETGSGADSSQEDNDEHCASCGGEGILLCCDGCTNSFHHSCLEPPLNPDEEVIGEWYCPQCIARRRRTTEESKAFLGRALIALDHAIPRAFALPENVREYFEGVRTGEEGEYTEFGQPRTHSVAPKMNRAGFIEEPNYKEPRDNKGNLNICKGCGLGNNGRDLVPCDYCDAKWHLDCIDPPLSIPPRRRIGDKPNASWRCPLHIEGDLSSLGRQAEAAPGDLGGEPRRRKPKNAKSVDVDFPRGFRNNGVIEVELEDDVAAIREIDMDGQVFRLPEQAIKLDFIDRVKRSWYEDKTYPYTANGRRPPRFIERDYRPTKGVIIHEPAQTTITIKEPEFYKGSRALSVVETAKANAAMRRKTLPEQQAILQLASMAAENSTSSYGDELADLTNTLIAEAPERVEQLQVRDERASLQRLQSLIDRRMRILDGREGPPDPIRPQGMRKTSSRRESGPIPGTTAMRGFRELQPAPPQQGMMSPTQQPQYGSLDGMLPNGSGQYPMTYGAPPPAQPGQGQAYPFPNPGIVSGGGYMGMNLSIDNSSSSWQAKPPPLPANISPWQPQPLSQQQSPVKSPYAGYPSAQSFAGGAAGSPTLSMGLPIKIASQPSTPSGAQSGGYPLLAPHPGAGASSNIYGPAPPLSVSTPMHRAVSMASAASAGSGAGTNVSSGGSGGVAAPGGSRRSSRDAGVGDVNSAAVGANANANASAAANTNGGGAMGNWRDRFSPANVGKQPQQPNKDTTASGIVEEGNLDPALFTSVGVGGERPTLGQGQAAVGVENGTVPSAGGTDAAAAEEEPAVDTGVMDWIIDGDDEDNEDILMGDSHTTANTDTKVNGTEPGVDGGHVEPGTKDVDAHGRAAGDEGDGASTTVTNNDALSTKAELGDIAAGDVVATSSSHPLDQNSQSITGGSGSGQAVS